MERETIETELSVGPELKRAPGAAALLVLWLAFSLFALGIYGPALGGPFLSDDFGLMAVITHDTQIASRLASQIRVRKNTQGAIVGG